MPNNDRHIKLLDEKISDLSDALAHLGKGTDLAELLRIIRKPGWTTPAEFRFSVALVETMKLQVDGLAQTSARLLEAAKVVGMDDAPFASDLEDRIMPKQSDVTKPRPRTS
ncbi:MAG: hypothetical protein ACREPE_16125 [Lysobacter sp.]